jgi:hypothetical protein
MVIWKYPLEITQIQDVMMPEGAQIITITVETYGTGETLSQREKRHIGTYQVMGGEIVFHVFASCPTP